MKRRLLWIGDAAVSSGFARATHHILASLMEAWDIVVIGINHNGDPPMPGHAPYPYPIYPAQKTFRQEPFGTERIVEIAELYGPALVVVQQDPWNFQQYLVKARGVPVVGVVAVDGTNCRGSELNGLEHAIFWTNYGEIEARRGGYTGPASVIPLGVDRRIYQAVEKPEARARLRLQRALEPRGLKPDVFIVGAFGRNQFRKRLDLTIQYFADWIHQRGIEDACLWLHVAPTGDDAFDLDYLCRYYGISDRVMVPGVSPIHGTTEETLAYAYAMCDVVINTAQGEGWWLPGLEALACGTPLIVPDWAALGAGEWPTGAAIQVPCSGQAATAPRGISSIGGIIDKQLTVAALDMLYRDHNIRAQLRENALKIASQARFDWGHIGQRYVETLDHVMYHGMAAQHAMKEVV